MKRKRVIVWFRQDLRLHDNEAFQDAIRSGEEVVPVFIFDERVFMGKTRFGFPKTGVHRSQFIIDAVADLTLGSGPAQIQRFNRNRQVELGANLEGTNFTNAQLIRAYLSHANLDNTDLSEADLSGADVTRASLSTSKVTGTKFTQNIGMTQDIELQLRKNGAFFFKPYTTIQKLEAEQSTQKDYFTIIRRVDEIKADLKYRHQDLEEAWSIFEDTVNTFQLFRVQNPDSMNLKDNQNNKIEQLLLTMENDLIQSLDAIEKNKKSLDDIVNKSSNEDVLEWVEQDLLDELDSIHEAIMDLNRHTGLIYTLWKSLGEKETT